MTVTCPACYGFSKSTDDDICAVCYGNRAKEYTNDEIIRLTYEKILQIERKVTDRWGKI